MNTFRLQHLAVACGLGVAIGAIGVALRSSPPLPSAVGTIPSPRDVATSSQPSAQRPGSRAAHYRAFDGDAGTLLVDRLGRVWTPRYDEAAGMTVFTDPNGNSVGLPPWTPQAGVQHALDGAPVLNLPDVGTPR
jgi:hypothetical protein